MSGSLILLSTVIITKLILLGINQFFVEYSVSIFNIRCLN